MMNNKLFWTLTVAALGGLLMFAGIWLHQNEQLQRSVLDGNERQAQAEAAMLRNQVVIRKILDDRTPLIEKIKGIEENQKSIVANQRIIHELRRRIEELEKNQKPEILKKRIEEIK